MSNAVAYGALVAFWLTLAWRPFVRIRRGVRDRKLVVKVFVLRTVGLVVLVVSVVSIRFWADPAWEDAAIVAVTCLAMWGLRRTYRRLVLARPGRIVVGSGRPAPSRHSYPPTLSLPWRR